jgi:hypothetical protein
MELELLTFSDQAFHASPKAGQAGSLTCAIPIWQSGLLNQ